MHKIHEESQYSLESFILCILALKQQAASNFPNMFVHLHVSIV